MEGAGRRQGRMPGLRNDSRVWETRGKSRVDVTWDGPPTRILLSGTGYTYARGAPFPPVPGKKTFHVSIQLSMNEYIRGIAEVPTDWPTATLKAQAVAARAMRPTRCWGTARSEALTQHGARTAGAISTATRDQYYIGWAKETSVGRTW